LSCQEVWKFLKELKKNKELFEALGDIWKEIGIRVAQVAKYGLILARWLIKFITDHRELFKQMAIWTGYAVAIATVVAGLLSAVIGAGLFIATMKLMLPLIISAVASIATVVLWIGALIAIGAVLYRAYQDNWGGFKDLVDTVYWAVVGLFEIIKNWTDGTSEMSEKTAKNLKKMWATGLASSMCAIRSRRTLASVTSTPHFSQITPRCLRRLYLPHRHS
jgi:hypothetical protein